VTKKIFKFHGRILVKIGQFYFAMPKTKKIKKKFDQFELKNFFSPKSNNLPKSAQFDHFWDFKKSFWQFYAICKKFRPKSKS
jgi:hypothetical protein